MSRADRKDREVRKLLEETQKMANELLAAMGGGSDAIPVLDQAALFSKLLEEVGDSLTPKEVKQFTDALRAVENARLCQRDSWMRGRIRALVLSDAAKLKAQDCRLAGDLSGAAAALFEAAEHMMQAVALYQMEQRHA